MDSEDDWLSSSEVTEEITAETTAEGPIADGGTTSGTVVTAASNIPTGPPVPNPYAHVLDVPVKQRQFTHWGRPTFLRYKLLTEYYKNYYEDYIDYMDKRNRGLYRETPRAQEWAERICRVYTRDGKKLSATDYRYWLTDKNIVKPKSSIFHAVHSKDYYRRQYYNILF